MRRRCSPRGRVRLLLRRLGLSRNPMRRPIDRVQGIVRVLLLAAFLACAPVTAVSLGHRTYVSALHTQRVQQTAWHPVPARILRVKAVAAAWRRPTQPLALMTVRWASPDGASCSGQTMGAANAAIGSLTRVWIDDSGRLAHRPLSDAEISSQVTRTGITAVAGLALALAIASRLLTLALDRRRLARWETDWATVEPQWTSRH